MVEIDMRVYQECHIWVFGFPLAYISKESKHICLGSSLNDSRLC